MAELLVGYDGSPSAAGAIEIGALLLPGAKARIAHVWSPPFASRDLRERLWPQASNIEELTALIESEGQAESERIASAGAVLARAAGWDAEPLVERNVGDQGFALADVAGRLAPDAVVTGARGLAGASAVLGSVSDRLVHYSPVPVLVVPATLSARERAAAASGPVVVGHDGSDGAARALATAGELFADRARVAVSASGEPETADVGDVEHVTVAPHGVGTSGRAIADALAADADARGAGVVVVGSRGRSTLKAMLLGSVAMATLHHAHRPVLVVPPADRFAS